MQQTEHGLVVKGYLRALGRDEDGKLRHAISKDDLGDGDLLARDWLLDAKPRGKYHIQARDFVSCSWDRPCVAAESVPASQPVFMQGSGGTSKHGESE